MVTIVSYKKLISAFKLLNEVDSELASQITPEYLLDDFSKFNLTTKENECLFFLIRGKTLKEIATILTISPRTVETHAASRYFRDAHKSVHVYAHENDATNILLWHALRLRNATMALRH